MIAGTKYMLQKFPKCFDTYCHTWQPLTKARELWLDIRFYPSSRAVGAALLWARCGTPAIKDFWLLALKKSRAFFWLRERHAEKFSFYFMMKIMMMSWWWWWFPFHIFGFGSFLPGTLMMIINIIVIVVFGWESRTKPATFSSEKAAALCIPDSHQ